MPRLLLLPIVLMATWTPLAAPAQTAKRDATPTPPVRVRFPHDVLYDDARAEPPLPFPKAVTLAEVTGGDSPESHAFFIKLPSSTALVVCTNSRKIDEVRVNGNRVPVGKLLRRPPIAAYQNRGAWVWEAAPPAGVIPLLRPKATLPLIVHDTPYSEFVILTSRGPRRAKLSPNGGHTIVVPGQRLNEHFSVDVPESEDFASIKVGDPVVHALTGIVIGGVTDPGYANSPFTCGMVFLTFPEPPEKLKAPLKEVWGLPVEAAPRLDDAFVQKILPVHALSLKLGEKVDDARRRHPFLVGDAAFFGEEWAFWSHTLEAEGGLITAVECGNYVTADQASLLTTWLAQKFGDPIQLHLTRDKTDLRAIWQHPAGLVIFCCGGTAGSPKMRARLRIGTEPDEDLDHTDDMRPYAEPATANRANFLKLTQAIITEVKKAKPLDDGTSLFRKPWKTGE